MLGAPFVLAKTGHNIPFGSVAAGGVAMDSVTSPPPGQTATHPLGVGEPLPVVDLPEPEEAFGVPHLGRKEVVRFVLGPRLIALGISIGSGEWLLGPLNVGTLGFVG